MRPRSLAGPLLLIATGALFLAANWQPDFSALEFLGRFWPMLLIIWGAVRVLEILVWFAQGRKLPLSGISGGEWFLAFLIGITGSSIYLFETHMTSGRWEHLAARGVEMFGDTYSFDFEPRELAVETDDPAIIIEGFDGKISITGVQERVVHISGSKKVRAFDEHLAQPIAEAATVNLTSQDGKVYARFQKEHFGAEAKVSVDAEISVPEGASIEVRSGRGDCRIQNIGGSIEIQADDLDAEVTGVGGDVRITSRRGDDFSLRQIQGRVNITGRGDDLVLENVKGPVEIDGDYTGDLDFRELQQELHFRSPRTEFRIGGVPGSLHLNLGDLHAEGLLGPLRLRSRSSDVHIEQLNGAAEVNLDKGDVYLQLPSGTEHAAEIKVDSGKVVLALPRDSSYAIRAETKRGRIDAESRENIRIEEQDRGAVLVREDNGPAVYVQVGRGDITLHDAGGGFDQRRRRRQPDSPKRPPGPPPPPPAE